MRRILPLLLLVATPAAARTVEDRQVWLNTTLMKNPSGDTGFAWFAEVQPRIAKDGSRLSQLLLRPAIGWKLSADLTVYAGYAHVVLPAPGHDRNEERVFGQVSLAMGRIAGGALSSRTRLEHRRLSDGKDAGWRARGMLRYVHPLGAPEQPRALVSSEVFWNFNDTDWGARSGFDQMRNFAGIEAPVGGRSTLELGYLNQYANARAGVRRMNHVASVSVFIRP